MTNASPRRRKKQPFNPAKEAHDRRATDLLRNARVSPIEVDDPFEVGAKILVMRSTRNDPIADMHARGHLSDCEYATARHWERAYEDSAIGGVPAMDPGKESVDGGKMAEVLTDRQIKAIKELKLAREELGNAGNWLIIQVLGTKKTIEDVAWEWKQAKRDSAGCKYIRRRFHECLSTLSVLFGYAMPTRA